MPADSPGGADAEPLLLFGMPVSLYTGKARSYLRKAGITFTEVLPADPRFRETVLPRIGRFMIPVITRGDVIVQDTTAIIDWCEAQGLARFSVYPRSAVQRLVALVLDLHGGEGLVRTAMHYRWSYRAQQEAFLQHEFGLSLRAAGLRGDAWRERTLRTMAQFNGYLPQLGVTAETIPAIEAAYVDLLSALDDHFREVPYALGGQPTCADFGLIAPLWAHLGRDPWPAHLMKCTAPSVWRWVERMQSADADAPEFGGGGALADDDSIPPTLLPVLRRVAADYLPELQVLVETVDRWLLQNPGVPDGERVVFGRERSAVARPVFRLRGTAIPARISPYTLWMLQRVTDAFAALDAAAADRVQALLDTTGLGPLVTLRATRRIERIDHQEVWGARV